MTSSATKIGIDIWERFVLGVTCAWPIASNKENNTNKCPIAECGGLSLQSGNRRNNIFEGPLEFDVDARGWHHVTKRLHVAQGIVLMDDMMLLRSIS